MPDKRFYGFLALNQTESKDGYWAGVLVIDEQGVPAEFRVTYPVRPTIIQRTLYGESLESYIGVELCGKPLLQALDHKIELLSVNREDLLDVRASTDCPAVCISKAGQVIEVSSPAGPDDQRNRKRLELEGDRFQPISISVARDHPEDLGAAEPIAQALFTNVDLLEPFGRIAEAMKALAAQDKKFQ